jgi:hypothetical protein
MTKRKKTFETPLLLALVIVCVVEVFTNLYWNQRVKAVHEENVREMDIVNNVSDRYFECKNKNSALEKRYDNMRRYAWKLEKKIEKLDKKLEYEAEVKP